MRVGISKNFAIIFALPEFGRNVFGKGRKKFAVLPGWGRGLEGALSGRYT